MWTVGGTASAQWIPPLYAPGNAGTVPLFLPLFLVPTRVLLPNFELFFKNTILVLGPSPWRSTAPSRRSARGTTPRHLHQPVCALLPPTRDIIVRRMIDPFTPTPFPFLVRDPDIRRSFSQRLRQGDPGRAAQDTGAVRDQGGRHAENASQGKDRGPQGVRPPPRDEVREIFSGRLRRSIDACLLRRDTVPPTMWMIPRYGICYGDAPCYCARPQPD